MRKIWLLLPLAFSSCYVNRAAVDPFAFAPHDPSCYWTPEKEDLSICLLTSCDQIELPCSELPLSLAEVIDIGLLNNPQTEKSWAEARHSAALYGKSQSAFFPELIGEYSYNRSRTSYLASQVEQPENIFVERLIINTQSQWGPQLNLAWTLLDFGKRRYTSEAARYALYYADYLHNEILQRLIQDLTLDYYTYLYQVRLLEANEMDLFNAQKTLEAAELALKRGAKNISDLLQARTQALLSEITLFEQKKAVSDAYATLLEMMGLPANAKIELEKLPLWDPDPYALPPLEDYLAMALDCRPDLLASRSQLKSAEMSLKSAKRLWVPSVNYSLEIGETSFSGGFSDDYNYVSTFTLSIPLFTGFSIHNTIRAAEAKKEQAAAILKENELKVVAEMTTAHFDINIAFDTLKTSNQFLKAAKEEFDVAFSQYQMGVNTILDLISAQTSLAEARARQALATRQWFSALATLTYSAGILCYNTGELP